MKNCYSFTIFAILLAFCNCAPCQGQIHTSDIIRTIDHRIDSLEIQCQTDTNCVQFHAHGQTKYHRKIIGFIKIRIGKGETFRDAWVICQKLFLHQTIDLIGNRNKRTKRVEKYYFEEGNLVKYEAIEQLSKIDKKEESIETINTVYFKNNELIEYIGFQDADDMASIIANIQKIAITLREEYEFIQVE